MSFSREDLRPLEIFRGLSDDQLEWLATRGERVALQPGEHMFDRGKPASALWTVVEGVIQGFEEIGGEWLLVATTHAGEVTGMLPFSRMTHYPRHTVAAEPSVVLRLDVQHFRELLDVSHELVQRLVAQMSDRVRGDVRLEQQGEKLMALGRLSAGLAHELNNPAAAIRRASIRLAEHRATLPGLVTALAGRGVPAGALEGLAELRSQAAAGEASEMSVLERSDLEERLTEWLEENGIDEGWEVAATLSDMGVEVDRLQEATAEVPEEALGDVLAWLSAGIESDQIVTEITAASERISDLVASIKTYSHMGRSPEHKPTDVRVGLDSTLTMLGHKLKTKNVRVTRDYDPDLPLIPANAGELNQVWTNLTDNAVDAMGEGGQLTVRARKNDLWVEVEIEDDGPGIPAEMQSAIFEPFYTTKEVGVGTGLGLGIAQRIVKTHQGHIEVRSRPGSTVMCVRLPIERTTPVGEGAGSSDAPDTSKETTTRRDPMADTDASRASTGTGKPTCEHVDGLSPVEPDSPDACPRCVEMGDTWVHLRVCLECGAVGCCDNSKNTHATRHHHDTGHAVIQSYEPGEGWRYCYVDGMMLPGAEPLR